MVKKSKTNKALLAEKKKRKALLAKLKLLRLKAKKKIIQKQKQNQKQEVIVNNIISQVTKTKRKKAGHAKEEKLEDRLKDRPRPLILHSLANQHNANTQNMMRDLDKAKLEVLNNRIKELENMKEANKAIEGGPQITGTIQQGETVVMELLKDAAEEDDQDIILLKNMLREKEKEVVDIKRQEKSTQNLARIAKLRESELVGDILSQREKKEKTEDQLENIDQVLVTLDPDKAEEDRARKDRLDQERAKLNADLESIVKNLKNADDLLDRRQKEKAEAIREAEIAKSKEQSEAAEKEADKIKEQLEEAKKKRKEQTKKATQASQTAAEKRREEHVMFYKNKLLEYSVMDSEDLDLQLERLKKDNPFGTKGVTLYKDHIAELKRIKRQREAEEKEEKEQEEKEERKAEKERRKAEKGKKRTTKSKKEGSKGASGIKLTKKRTKSRKEETGEVD